ncbi:MAG TPA: NAD-dependent epimerase/dehydratase family protein [Chitinophagaceae bacterium]|nr:NAD-dependent epimerase/dehydratase family protein [Chitinophagaceae bacterium]
MNSQNSPLGVGGNKVLVTGGTGFIGAYIIKELIEKGYAVRAIRRSNKLPFFISPDILNKTEWVYGDVLDVISLNETMQGVDGIIHAAALVSFVKKERRQMYHTNAAGTANIVNLALENGIKKLVHVSSISALGRTYAGEHVTEEKKWTHSKLNSHYGISKYKAEMEVWRGCGEGLDAVIINPSTVLGFGNWHDGSCAIFKNLYRGFPWYTKGINGFVDVEDVAKIAVMLMETNITEERFIVNNENWEFKKLFDAIADGFGKKHPNWEANSFLSAIAWRIEKIKSSLKGSKPLLTKETARIGLSKTHWENDKILAVFPGFSFTPLEQSIAKACKNYVQALNDMQLKP